MTLSLPHLPDFAGEAALGATETRETVELEELVGVSHEQQVFPTASGDRITEVRLREIRDAVLGVARVHGFPTEKLSRTAGFDRDCAEVLYRELPITIHDAASRGAWTFLTCVLLIDVAVWRFPSRTPARFLGDPNRNAFRRLWMRREILGPPHGEDDPLWDREDALVQVMERPGVAESRELTRDIADVYREEWGARPGPEREHLMRNFMLRVMRRQGLTRLECVTETRRREILTEVASETLAAFEADRRQPGPGRPSAKTSRERNRQVDGQDVAPSADAGSTAPSSTALEDLRGAGVTGNEGERSEAHIEETPISNLVNAVFRATQGLEVGYPPRALVSRMLRVGVIVDGRNRKTVELIAREFRDAGQLIRGGEGNRVWKAQPGSQGFLEPRVKESIADIRQLARDLDLTEKEDRVTLAGSIGLAEPLPKYLRRIINSAIG